MGAPALLASAGLAANRWRSAALAAPVLLVVVLVGVQGVLLTSDAHHVRAVSAERVSADHVVSGRDGAPIPLGTAGRLAGLPGVRGVTATMDTEVVLTESGRDDDGDPWEAVGLDVSGVPALDLGVTEGDLSAVRGHDIAISRIVAEQAGLHPADVVAAHLADGSAASLRVAAVYTRSAGLGDIVLDPRLARSHAADPADDALFVAGGPAAGTALAADAAGHPGLGVHDRGGYLATRDAAGQEQQWAIWLIIGLMAAFSTLSLVTTAAMTTAERRTELATIRLLGGTARQVARAVVLETLPAVLSAVVAGAALTAIAVMGVPNGVTGIPIAVPLSLIAAVAGGALTLGLLAAALSARMARRASPAEAMRLGG